MFTGDIGKVAFAFLGAIEEFSNNMGQLLTVLDVQDEWFRSSRHTCSYTRSEW
jgi:hypothetical protein